MGDTTIAWTNKTWNPIRGCSRVSAGCTRCYAERQAARFSGPGEPFHGFVERTASGPRWTGRIELIEEKLDEPLRWRKPARIFVNSMSDLFHESLPDEAIERIFGIMFIAQRHTFQVLTKRPERMREWSKARKTKTWFFERKYKGGRTEILSGAHLIGLPNVWLGVSVEDQAMADERIPILLDTPAAVRFVSAEPLLGPIEMPGLWPTWGGEWNPKGKEGHGPPLEPALSWLIVGGESGPGARPCDIAWIRSIRDQCREAGVACFIKQLGARPFTSEVTLVDWPEHVYCDDREVDRLILRSKKGGEPNEWEPGLRVREFPKEPTRA